MRWLLIILVLIGIAAAVTNPAEDDLRGVLSQFVSAKVDEKVDQMAPPVEGLPGPLGELKDRAKDALKPAIMDNIGIRRNNYVLFSVFHLDVPNVPMEKAPPQCVIGAFKVVFIPLQSC
jgi:hypothetical protein